MLRGTNGFAGACVGGAEGASLGACAGAEAGRGSFGIVLTGADDGAIGAGAVLATCDGAGRVPVTRAVSWLKYGLSAGSLPACVSTVLSCSAAAALLPRTM